MNETVKQATDTKRQLVEEIARIEGLSQAKKWKAAQQFVLKVNPEARKDHEAIVIDVKNQRAQLAVGNKFAASKDGRRWALRMPQSVLLALELFDPQLHTSTKKDPEAQKKELHKMMRTFPEYVIPRSI